MKNKDQKPQIPLKVVVVVVCWSVGWASLTGMYSCTEHIMCLTGELMINGAMVTTRDYSCTNGVLYGIDAVLMPPDDDVILDTDTMLLPPEDATVKPRT